MLKTLPDKEAPVEDQYRFNPESRGSRARGEFLFPSCYPPLDHRRNIVALKASHPEEADLQENGMARETKKEAPGVVEHARIQGNDGQGVCMLRGMERGYCE